MIKIERVESVPFPVVDFKFVNRGRATGVLWQIGICVDAIEIDPTPVISFNSFVGQGIIELAVENNGWGPARFMKAAVGEPLLDELFQSTSFYIAELPAEGYDSPAQWSVDQLPVSGRAKIADLANERQRLLAVVHKGMRQRDKTVLEDQYFRRLLSSYEKRHVSDFFRQIEENFLAHMDWHMDSIAGSRHRDAIPIAPLELTGSFQDLDGATVRHKQVVFPSGDDWYDSQVWLSPSGFELERHRSQGSVMIPSMVIAVKVDAVTPPMERRYPVSIEIAPGSAERFQIVTFADRSCHAQAKFIFYFDGGKSIASNQFDLSIWRPKGSEAYADGADLVEPSAVAKFSKNSGRWILEQP